MVHQSAPCTALQLQSSVVLCRWHMVQDTHLMGLLPSARAGWATQAAVLRTPAAKASAWKQHPFDKTALRAPGGARCPALHAGTHDRQPRPCTVQL